MQKRKQKQIPNTHRRMKQIFTHHMCICVRTRLHVCAAANAITSSRGIVGGNLHFRNTTTTLKTTILNSRLPVKKYKTNKNMKYANTNKDMRGKGRRKRANALGNGIAGQTKNKISNENN